MAWSNLTFVAGTVLPADSLNSLVANFTALADGSSGAPTFTNSCVERAIGYPVSSGQAVLSTSSGTRYFATPELFLGTPVSSGQAVLSTGSASRYFASVELSLGNPGTTGYVLSSTTAGVRSWINPVAGGSAWSVKTTSYQASDGDRVTFNTSGSALAVTLPASPSAGNIVTIADYAGTFSTNGLLVGRNGHRIMTRSEDMLVSNRWVQFKIEYVDSATGWRIDR